VRKELRKVESGGDCHATTNMGTTPSILAVPSSSPEEDVDYLQRIFPRQFRVEESADESSTTTTTVLLGEDGNTVFLLMRSLERVSDVVVATTTWAVDDKQIQATAAAGDEELVRSVELSGSASINEIILPGGSRILMVPHALAQTAEGRTSLAAWLSSTTTSCHNHASSQNSVDESKDAESMQDVELNSRSNGGQTKPTAADATESSNLPIFPSLELKLLEQEGIRRTFRLNSQTPMDVETDLFSGKTLVIVRPQNPESDDPYWNRRIFSKKKRRLMIQIQGKFKKEPKGIVYAGAEVSEAMKLGLVTRGICQVLLRLVESFNKNVHYSFGDKEGRELPHIVAPAFSFFDRVVATPAGEDPPPMDEPFEESAESLANRKKTKSYGSWNTTDTYSFSFYSMYIDLPTWQLVGLPASGDLSLKTFWGESLLRICMYEKVGTAKQHCQDSNRYAFSVEAKFLGKHGKASAQRDTDLESSSFDEGADGNIITWSERRRSLVMSQQENSLTSTDMNRSESFVLPSKVEDEYDLEFFDAEETESATPKMGSIQEINETAASFLIPVSVELLSAIDSVCPARVDLFTRKGYSRAFAVNVKSKTLFRSEEACEELVGQSIGNKVDEMIEGNFSPRLAPSEILRRSVGLVLSRITEQTGVPSNAVKAFESMQSQSDGGFLTRAKPTLTVQQSSVCRISGFVARALSDRHWIEEWAMVIGRYICFHTPDKSKAHFRVNLSNVTKSERLAPALCPQFFGYHVLALTTLGRTVYLMFASESQVDEWIEVVDSLRAPPLENNGSVSSLESDVVSKFPEMRSLTDEFLHKSSMFQCKNRKILNCAKFYFRNDSDSNAAANPLALAEDALEKALKVPMTEGAEEDLERRRAFLDSAAELKRASVDNLDEESRLAFFLNVYHVMISHAFLLLGPPDSGLQWINYFNCQAYQVGDDLFSLSELEHCIIRANMAFPSQFLSKFLIPKSRYHMALRSKSDFRINFALNCGSLSNPPRVLIYRPEKLSEQLDMASRLYLAAVTYRRTSCGDLEIKLPKICQWYAEDFGSSRQKLLKLIEIYFEEDLRQQLANCWEPSQEKFDCDVRYLSYSFECRPLSL